MKQNLQFVLFGVALVAIIAFFIFSFFWERPTQKNIYERDGHDMDKIFYHTSPHIIHSPDCKFCEERDSIMREQLKQEMKDYVDSVLKNR
jgi:hypothetical protein